MSRYFVMALAAAGWLAVAPVARAEGGDPRASPRCAADDVLCRATAVSRPGAITTPGGIRGQGITNDGKIRGITYRDSSPGISR